MLHIMSVTYKQPRLEAPKEPSQPITHKPLIRVTGNTCADLHEAARMKLSFLEIHHQKICPAHQNNVMLLEIHNILKEVHLLNTSGIQYKSNKTNNVTQIAVNYSIVDQGESHEKILTSSSLPIDPCPCSERMPALRKVCEEAN